MTTVSEAKPVRKYVKRNTKAAMNTGEIPPDVMLKPSSIDGLIAINKDIRAAAETMSVAEARILVSLYYDRQKSRISADNNAASLEAEGLSNHVLNFMATNAAIQEKQAELALGRFANADPLGRWARSICGIGPIIAGGLLATIDLSKVSYVGQVDSFCGMNPRVDWLGKERATALVREAIGTAAPTYEDICRICEGIHRVPRNVVNICFNIANRKKKKQHDTPDTPDTPDVPDDIADPESLPTPEARAVAEAELSGVLREEQVSSPAAWLPTNAQLIAGLSMRPWCANAKTLLWKAGMSFVKQQSNPRDFYGRMYAERKAYEWVRNLRGELAEVATKDAAKYGKGTDAYVWASGCMSAAAAGEWLAQESGKRIAALKRLAGEPGSGVPMIPPAHVDARARRWAVKLFLSHYCQVGHAIMGRKPIVPWPIAFGGHTRMIDPPNFDLRTARTIDESEPETID